MPLTGLTTSSSTFQLQLNVESRTIVDRWLGVVRLWVHCYIMHYSFHGHDAIILSSSIHSKCLHILYYGIDVCPLTNTQINSLQFVINSCYSKIFMIKSTDDIRYCQDVFGCFPVADIVKTRTAKFLKKYKEANDNNIVCQACSRY